MKKYAESRISLFPLFPFFYFGVSNELMSNSQSNKILATINAEDFIGRACELDTLRRHARGETKSPGLLILSAPAAGASEILKQTYDRLFREQNETIPFYFAASESDVTAKDFAARFLQTFIAQIVAFRHQEPKIFDASPDLRELVKFAAADDAYWIERLVASQNESALNDDRAFVRSCLSAPLRAAAHGANSFVMIDDLHESDFSFEEINFIEELKEIFSRSPVPFVLAGKRRFLLNAAQTGNAKLADAEILRIEPLDFTDAGLLAENLAGKYELEITEQTRDLIARQTSGKPTFIKFLLQAASKRRLNLDSFQTVEQVYTDELFGGRTGKFYDSIFQKIAPSVGTQKNIVELLYNALFDEDEKTPPDSWQMRLDLSDEKFNRAMRFLNAHEIIRLSSNLVEAANDNEILSDYIRARFRLEIAAESRASVVGEMLSDFLKRAPKTMAKFYRQSSSINLRGILAVFNCQEMPTSLLDYSIFKNTRPDEVEIPESEIEKIRLPQIVYTAHTVAFYPAINQVTDEARSAVALGFEERAYTDEDETVWIAAEIDSKLEASRETTEFWCDRLEMVALTCNFTKYKIWLVAPEGFAPEAMEVLRQRNAFGSSRKQVKQLKKFLDAGNSNGGKPAANEYEIIVPMGEDTELIAANAVEEIARRHRFEPKAVNQIKTALVEACINATEHSLSPDRKIYQKFSVEDDKIVITISNRGLRLTDVKIEEIQPEENRRGWGLKLMRTLMDEVKIEQVDDGTRISMTKYRK